VEGREKSEPTHPLSSNFFHIKERSMRNAIQGQTPFSENIPPHPLSTNFYHIRDRSMRNAVQGKKSFSENIPFHKAVTILLFHLS
jgi:hypothetical protein